MKRCTNLGRHMLHICRRQFTDKLTCSIPLRHYSHRGQSRNFMAALLKKSLQNNDVETTMLTLSMNIENEPTEHKSALISLASLLIQTFSACGCLKDAVKIFDFVSERSIDAWTAIIAAHSDHGIDKQVVILYKRMHASGSKPNPHTFVYVLRACSKIEALDQGRLVHCDLFKQGFQLIPIIGNSLIDMYTKCGSFDDACVVFSKLLSRTVVSWNAMLSGYVQHGCNAKALELFAKMKREGLVPNNVTLACILRVCAEMVDLNQGNVIHVDLCRRGVVLDVILGGALVNMYAKCYALNSARWVFDGLQQKNEATWSALIFGYVESDFCEEALTLFCRMQQACVRSDSVAFLSALKACAGKQALNEGKLVHTGMLECDQESTLNVYAGSVLIDMYAKSGSLEDACNVLEKLKSRNVVCWSALMDGYAEYGQGENAMSAFVDMQKEGIKPTEATFVSLLKACAIATALREGRLIHSHIMTRDFESDARIGNTLVDMYAKCGSLGDAHKMFDRLHTRNLISWSAMISGYATHGHFTLAEQYFERMSEAGIQPDGVTFASLLTACSHAGLVDQGRFYFGHMSKYSISPDMEHYASLIDLFGRAGRLQDAENLVCKMPVPPDAAILKTLLGSCSKFDNLEISKRTFDVFQRCDRAPASGYVLMSNIYASHCS